MSEEEKEELKSLIEEYEICYKESEYEGNVEEYKELKDTHKLLNNVLNYIDKLQKELDKKDKEIKRIKGIIKWHIEREKLFYTSDAYRLVVIKLEEIMKEIKEVEEENDSN